jgi:hypothetical protein
MELATWVLGMLQENTNKIIASQMQWQMGRIDLGGNKDDEGGDTSDAGMRARAKAEQEGLIKMIEEKFENMDLGA